MKRHMGPMIALCLIACSDRASSPPPMDTAQGGGKDLAAAEASKLPDQGAGQEAFSPDRALKSDRFVIHSDQAGLKPDKAVIHSDGNPACTVPSCCNIGSKSEGWCGCAGLLTKPGSTLPYWDLCSKCTALCKDCGTGCKSNGYYSSCDVTQVIQYTTCSECKPKCDAIGSYSEGWYDSCTGKILLDPSTGNPLWTTCSKCTVACQNCGAGCKSNGYYSSCSPTLPILYADCVP